MRRPLLIVGLPASLKSELAREVAERSGRRLLVADLATLEKEWSALDAPVIELASDAWLDRGVRVAAIDRCVVVSVGTSFGLGGTLPTGIGRVEAKLWHAASVAFEEAHRVVRMSVESVGAVAEEVLGLWRRDPVAVAAGNRSYEVEVGAGIVNRRIPEVLGGAAAHLLVTDSNVDGLYGARIQEVLAESGARIVKVVFEAGERQKHLETLSSVFRVAQEGGIDRSSCVIGFGGGVVTDIAGFAAATWMRGLRWFGISTTLLGMVDASVGGKTGVDFGAGKNAVGAFWQPSAVVCDTEFLRTESERNFRSALAEVVKTALIGDPELFDILECEGAGIAARDPGVMAEVVRRCVRVKARVVGEDERESGVRATLNLGHTVGHALEAANDYGRWSHGEAVSLGLVAALRIGERLGFTRSDVADRVIRLQSALGLPVELRPSDLELAAGLVGHDKKKRGSGIRFIFVEEIGRVRDRMLMVEDLRELIPGLGT